MGFHRQTIDIILLHFPPEIIDYPPLHTAQLATKLERTGYRVAVVDLNIALRRKSKAKFKSFWLKINEHYWHEQHHLDDLFKSHGRTIDHLIQAITKIQAKSLFLELEYPKELFACEMIKRIRKSLRDQTIIVGGYSCYSQEQRKKIQELSDNGVDHFLTDVTGIALAEFLEDFFNRRNPANTPRETSKSHKKGHTTIGQDDTVFPTYQEFILDEYRNQYLPVSFGYGCIGTCTFCKKQIYPDKRITRPSRTIIEEISHHVNVYGITHFHMCGSPVNCNIQVLEEFCDTLLSTPLKISWSAKVIPHHTLSTPVLQKMKDAGCHSLIYCMVSGSDTILSQVNTGFNTATIKRALKMTNLVGLKSAITLVEGFPKEYSRELTDTMELLAENRPPLIRALQTVSVLKIYPGTKLFAENKENNVWIPAPLAIDKWKSADGNIFFVRKIRQHRLIYQGLGLHIPYNPSDLIAPLPAIHPLKAGKRLKEKEFQSYNWYEPWHTYHSDILSKAIISYVRKRNSVVDKEEVDYPFINGIYDGKKAFIGPETVHLDITNLCNFNCIACWDRSPLVRVKGKKDAFLKKSLSFELVTGLIDDLITLGGVRYIKFGGGGEPTIHPQFKEILTYLRSKDRYVEIDINTNFSLVEDTLLDLIINQQVNLLTVSLWAATPKVYVLTHPNQKEAAFEKIVANLKKITKNRISGLPRIFIHNVLMSQNHQDIEKMLALALDIGADEVHFTLVDPVPGKTESLLLTNQQWLCVLSSLKKIRPFVDKLNNYHDPETNRSILITNFHEFFNKLSRAEVEKGVYDKKALSDIPCYIGWTYTRIMADGRVIPCCKGHRLPMGNLNRNSFMEVWNSPRYETFRYNGLNLKKSAPYFAVMGNDGSKLSGCMNCDNIMHNTVMHDKFLCHSRLGKWFVFKMIQRWKRNH